MPSHFFAYMARMRLIRRWTLMHTTREENDQEHSLQVAMVAHALAALHNQNGGGVDEGKVTLMAIYHEAAEVITGDLAAPIKYFNPGIRDAFKGIERIASEKLASYLPERLQPVYRPFLFPEEGSIEWRLVKAADKISSYVKCVEECGAGNREFERARVALKAEIDAIELPEVGYFMETFVPSFALSLDGLD